MGRSLPTRIGLARVGRLVTSWSVPPNPLVFELSTSEQGSNTGRTDGRPSGSQTMALFPCDAGNHRYSGPQQTIYPAVVDGGDSARRKLRLCPAHFQHRVERLERHAHNAQIAFGEELDLGCLQGDGAVLDSPFQFFATVYAAHEERADWWAPIHAGCVTSVLEDWALPVDVAFQP